MNAKSAKTNSEDVQAISEEVAKVPYWLLKDGKCRKLGKQSEGGIKYQLLASDDRAHLHIRITQNEGGGYYSKELVSFSQVEECLSHCDPEKPFPSKTLKDAFVGRSSNNAGFLAAILREEGLLDAAKEPDSQHMLSADIAAWKQAALSPQGTKIEIYAPSAFDLPTPVSKKTLTLPSKT
ncbi:hypothetical protein LJR289_003145 [Pseudoduganella sp. LjRoot289]|uniref:hypothetical protein n=1 Tax=Pseudoduganella sp. LjRoot289 TaxID=3342314 RepID=UPI003ECED521